MSDYLQHGRRHHPTFGSDPIEGIPRISWGRMLDDGTVLDEGSGDWEGASETAGIQITFDPAWTTPPALIAICSDGGTPYGPLDTVPPTPPDGAAIVATLRADVYDLSTVVLISYDMDGNVIYPTCGFSFIAVGS